MDRFDWDTPCWDAIGSCGGKGHRKAACNSRHNWKEELSFPVHYCRRVKPCPFQKDEHCWSRIQENKWPSLKHSSNKHALRVLHGKPGDSLGPQTMNTALCNWPCFFPLVSLESLAADLWDSQQQVTELWDAFWLLLVWLLLVSNSASKLMLICFVSFAIFILCLLE